MERKSKEKLQVAFIQGILNLILFYSLELGLMLSMRKVNRGEHFIMNCKSIGNISFQMIPVFQVPLSCCAIN